MRLSTIVDVLDRIAPFAEAESWDNVGLLVGDPTQEIERVLLAIDATRAVIDEAARDRRTLVVAYHPPIFQGMKRFVAGNPAFEAARRGIAIVSPHTALDVAEGGTNDVLADAIGMTARAPLRASASGKGGIGRVGAVTGTRGELVARIKAAFGLDTVLVAGEVDAPARRAAVCAGAGGDLLGDALAAKVDVFLTGEVRHHDALRAVAAGVTVVALRHSASERKALEPLAARIREGLPDLDVAISTTDEEPFAFR